MRLAILTALAAVMVMTLSACGGGGNNNNNTPAVTVSPATANVVEGSTQQFTATVINSSSTTVTWQVNGVAGGNSSVGTIDATGLYTAPAIVPSPASVTVTAVLQANPNLSSNAIATITAVQFSNSSLKGNYIFSLSGIDTNLATFYAVGAITADGNGNITGGEEDLNDVAVGYVQATSITGTYTVGSDGRGTLTLSVPAISSTGFTYAFAIRALNNAALTEIDNNVVNATGNLEQQTATGVSAPSGNYAFGIAGSALCGTSVLNPINSIGLFSLSSGSVGGLQDTNCNGTTTQSQSLSGSYGAIDGLGRGIGSFSTSVGSADFVYYVISANRYRFVCPDTATFFLGSADLQSQASFANSDFNGGYVVNTSANTEHGSVLGVSYTLIQFNASASSVSSGHYDVNDTGTVGQASLGGQYSLASNGRVNGSFTVNGVALPFSMYLFSPTQAYYLDQRTTAIGGGNVYAQSASVTSNADWAGSYATKQFGYFLPSSGLILPANSSSVSGQISADGNGNLAGTLDFNDPNGVFPGDTLQGTYSVGTAAPGRTTATITTSEGTRTYVAYIVDQTRVLLLEVDTNLVSGGDAIRQF
ncbi:MAG: Ig-like domain-containing protein [Candidatus Korobacteraceae bacterium]